MKQISSVDLYFLTRELKGLLENQRIETFYYENGIFYIKIYIRGVGHKFLTNKVSKFIFLGDTKNETSEAKSFVMHLRKHLKNGFIREIEQIENERILKIHIEKKNDDKLDRYVLILELFSGGNIILADEQLNILNLLERKNFKDRTVKVKSTYTLPPQKELSFLNLKSEKLYELANESDLPIVKFLAIKLGIGGKYAEELLEKAKIEKNKKAPFEMEEIEKITNVTNSMLHNKISPKLILDKSSNPADFIPFEFIGFENSEKKDCKTFNETLKNYFEQFLEEKDLRKDKYEKELKKLENRLEKQLIQMKEINEEYEKYNNIGNKIYENYSLVEELLKSINKSAKEKGWEHVLSTVKENDKLSKVIKNINYKNNEIILDLK